MYMDVRRSLNERLRYNANEYHPPTPRYALPLGMKYELVARFVENNEDAVFLIDEQGNCKAYYSRPSPYYCHLQVSEYAEINAD